MAAVIAAVLLSLGTWLTVDVEAREVLFGWVKEVYEGLVDYRFFGKGEETDAVEEYVPEWIPENFSEDSSFDHNNGKTIVYTNEKTSQTLVFGYTRMEDSAAISYVGESIEPEIMSVRGLYAEFYHAAGDSTTNNLIWFDESIGMVFTIDGDVEKDVILHMAESVTMKDSPKS